MTERLAIVPARGGSKRIQNKNILDFCGAPMITHILRAAHRSGLFSKIHVSTEDEKIRRVATEFGFPPDFSRPDDLADDQTPIMPVLKYVTEEYSHRGAHFDEVWLLMACAPLIRCQHLIEASLLFDRNEGREKVLSVAEFPVPIEWAFDQDASGGLTPVNPGLFATRSQDLATRYYDAGAFAIYSLSEILQAQPAGSDTGFVGYVLPKASAVDIDTLEDWRLAEALFRSQTATD